jgi:hypothetical protein
MGRLQAEKEAAERRGMKMALTRDFRETVQADAKRDPAFRRGLLSDALESLLSGEVTSAKSYCVITSMLQSDFPSWPRIPRST